MVRGIRTGEGKDRIEVEIPEFVEEKVVRVEKKKKKKKSKKAKKSEL